MLIIRWQYVDNILTIFWHNFDVILTQFWHRHLRPVSSFAPRIVICADCPKLLSLLMFLAKSLIFALKIRQSRWKLCHYRLLNVSKIDFVLIPLFLLFLVQELFDQDEKMRKRQETQTKITMCVTKSRIEHLISGQRLICVMTCFYCQYITGHVWSIASTYYGPKLDSLLCVKVIGLTAVSRN